MDLLGDVGFPRCGIKIEDAGFAPPLHDRKAIEQDDLSLQCNHAHRIRISAHRQHGLGARAVLHVDEHGIGAGRLQRVDAVIEREAEIVGIDAADSVGGAGLPDHQSGLGVGDDPLQLCSPFPPRSPAAAYRS